MNITAAHQAILDNPQGLVYVETKDRYELDGTPVAAEVVLELFTAELLARIPWTVSYRTL